MSRAHMKVFHTLAPPTSCTGSRHGCGASNDTNVRGWSADKCHDDAPTTASTAVTTAATSNTTTASTKTSSGSVR